MQTFRFHIPVLVFFFGCQLCFTAQSQELPRGLSEAEKQIVASGFFKKPDRIPGAVTTLRNLDTPRSMAEWEELQAIVITWRAYPEILTEIVRTAQKQCEVIIISGNPNIVRETLTASGIDPEEQISFINAPSNSVWVRDYGPNPVYLGEVDSLVLVDWIYNRPRPQDDVLSGHVGNTLGLQVISLSEEPNDLVHTGGNFMSEGMGTGFSSKLVLEENGEQNFWGVSQHSEADIDAIMSAFMGIDQYVKFETLPFDGIHHIDMHMKILDEETILMGAYPDGVADGPQIEANLQYLLTQFQTAAGRPFRVIRIPMPPDQFGRYPDNNGFYRTYTNALFVNQAILVPTYDEQYDSTAIRIWQEAMPGYTVVGIDCNEIIPAGGAIHCITKEIGVDEPLWITHFRPDTPAAEMPIRIEASIKAHGGVKSATLYYSAEGGDVTAQVMDGMHTSWSTTIPGFPEGTIIRYYIEAESVNGKVATRPLPAPEGYFEIQVGGALVSTEETAPAQSVLKLPFPNPARAITCIPVENKFGTEGTIRLVNMNGRIMHCIHEGPMPAGTSRYFFDAGAFPPGMYLIELSTETNIKTQHILIH